MLICVFYKYLHGLGGGGVLNQNSSLLILGKISVPVFIYSTIGKTSGRNSQSAFLHGLCYWVVSLGSFGEEVFPHCIGILNRIVRPGHRNLWARERY